ncbi:EpsG family protein [[Pseudomonas] boreopolis]|uniref:EpsG family protein n=1 Tax=Xanthomonas boreopolis TaxID=86183 RepID=UPI003DA1759B
MEPEVILAISLPIFLGASCIFLSHKNMVVFHRHGKGQTALLLFFVVLPIFIYGLYLVGFRPETAGNDTPRYVATYRNLSGFHNARDVGNSYYGNSELLLWPFQSLFKPFLSVRGWLIANYCLVFFLVYVYYRRVGKSLHLASSIFALVFMTFFLVYAGNTMRQVLAIPIGALGFHLYRRGNVLAAILTLCVAIGFHWSATVLILAPIFSLGLFRRDKIYFLVPPLAALASTVLYDVIGTLVHVLNIAAFTDRFDLYFAEGHISHVGQVWKTTNFWICSLTSFVFLLVCRPSRYDDKSLHQFTLLFLTLMLFGMSNADFSERYMPYILLVVPFQVAMIIDRLPIASFIKNAIFLGFFLILAVLVFSSQSSQRTLGYFI